MSSLQQEIALTKMSVGTDAGSHGDKQKVLVDSLLDSVTGGWINTFLRWSKAI